MADQFMEIKRGAEKLKSRNGYTLWKKESEGHTFYVVLGNNKMASRPRLTSAESIFNEWSAPDPTPGD